MQAKTKAALISAFIFPGLGHLALKRALRGCLFAVPTVLAIGYLLRTTLALADRLVAEINAGTLALDPLLILERINAAAVDDTATNFASLVILVCWAGSIIDAWWLERGK